MSIKIIDDMKLTAIGNAIRSKAGTQGLIDIDDMPTAIANIPSGGTNKLKNRLVGWNYPAMHYVVTADDFPTQQEVGSGFTEMASCAFAGDYNVTSIEVPAYITSIAGATFWDCGNLEELTFLGGLTQLRTYSTAYSGNPIAYCDKLETLEIPLADNASISAMAPFAAYCAGLKTLRVTGSPRSISSMQYVAQNCYSLEEVELCDGFTSIGGTYYYPFNSCSKLKRLILHNTTVITLMCAKLTVGPNGTVPSGFEGIYVVDSLVDSYKSETNWSAFASYIKPISELVRS